MWSIGKGILWLLDGFFNIVDKIWRYRFFDNEYVNKIFSGAIIVACSWLALKVVIELIMNYIVKNDDRSSPLSVYKGIVLAIVMMFLVTPLFQFGHDISTALTDSVITISGMKTNTTAENQISKAIIRAMVYENEMEESKIDYLTSNWKTIDINETTGGIIGVGDCYVYSLNFFMLIVLAVVVVFLLFFIAIQMAKRVMEIALYKIIAPFCCTSLTSPKSQVFEVWCKSVMGVFLITIVQFVCIGLLLNLFGSAFTDNGVIAGIFLIIGALLFIITTPTIISSLLNQQSGINTAMGDIQSMMALGSGVSTGLGIAKAGASMALSGGATILNKGFGLAKTGFTNLSNLLNRGNRLTSEQQNVVRDSLSQHNPRRAYQQVNDFIQQNRGNNQQNQNSSAPLFRPHNTKFNPIKNQYVTSDKLDSFSKKE